MRSRVARLPIPLCITAIIGLALALSPDAAGAADMPGTYLPPPIVKTEVVQDFRSYGWYLRGDLGVAWGMLHAESATPFPDPTDSKLKSSVDAGFGFGVKTDWLRTDLTVDYLWGQKYSGTVAAPGDTTAKIQPTVALFNGYLDLGTWYRLTPYLGAGAGASYTNVYDYQSTGAPPFGGDTSKKQWTFAWAAMAGVAYQVAPNMQVDVGYRYLNIGDVKTGNDAFGAMTFKNVAAHEIRVGLRWSFDDLR